MRVLLIGDSIMNQAGVYLESSLEEQIGRRRRGPQRGPQRHRPAHPGQLRLAGGDPRAHRGVPARRHRRALRRQLHRHRALARPRAAPRSRATPTSSSASGRARPAPCQNELAVTGADIYWVNPPPMLADEGMRRVSYFRQIHRGIAEDWTGTVLIDGTDVLAQRRRQLRLRAPGRGRRARAGPHHRLGPPHRARIGAPRRRDRPSDGGLGQHANREHAGAVTGAPARRDPLDRPRVFAVEDTAVQLTWGRLGPGQLTVTVDGRCVTTATTGGPGHPGGRRAGARPDLRGPPRRPRPAPRRAPT